jgi:hypothetical protein
VKGQLRISVNLIKNHYLTVTVACMCAGLWVKHSYIFNKIVLNI